MPAVYPYPIDFNTGTAVNPDLCVHCLCKTLTSGVKCCCKCGYIETQDYVIKFDTFTIKVP